MSLPKFPATWTYSHDTGCYYFAPTNRTKPPYLRQIIVEAIVDVASDGSLAGVELGHWDAAAPLPPPKLVHTDEELKEQIISDLTSET